MNDTSDKQNQIPPLLTLDFKKKTKSKPNTDRTINEQPSLKKEQTDINPSTSLIEKKKQYSLAIRQRNLNSQCKKGKMQNGLEGEINKYVSVQNQGLRSCSLSSVNIIGKFTSDRPQHLNSDKKIEQPKMQKLKTLSKKSDSKAKMRDERKDKDKLKQISHIIDDFRDYSVNKKWVQPEFSTRNMQPRQSEFTQHLSIISQSNQIMDFSIFDKKLTMISAAVNQVIGPFVTDQMKEIDLLKKQNNTFKKDLANFRKENSSLKRQIDQYKKKIDQINERNQFLTSQNQDQLKLLQNFQLKMSESFQSCNFKTDPDNLDEPPSPSTQSNLQQILTSYQSQLFQATTLTKKLQFRNYMLQKRLLDQSQSHRKIMARQISVWKERYIKTRNQNLRLKDSRSQMLFEMSISSQM